jgi:hypothetical protein
MDRPAVWTWQARARPMMSRRVSENPYQAPMVADVAAPETEAEVIRRAHLSHEASVKGVGTLYVIGGLFGMLALAGLAIPAVEGSGAMGMQEMIVFLVVGILGVVQFIGGLGLRKLTNTGRVIGAIVAAIGLIGFPLGTIISGYILYLLLGAKGKMVFSPEYRDIIARTPHIRYRTSKWVWFILLLFVVLIVAGVVAAVFTTRVSATP